jgi:hypothetical protein
MLHDLKLKLCAAAIYASASFDQSGASEYSAFIGLAFAVLRSFASTIQRSLPASWRESAGSGVLSAHLFPKHHTLEHHS